MTKLFRTLISEEERSPPTQFDGILSKMSTNKRNRYRVFLTVKQGFVCCYCKCSLTLKRPAIGDRQGNYSTFEHTVDVFDGAGEKDESLDKITMSCADCNNVRGTRREVVAKTYYRQFYKDGHRLQRALETIGWKEIIKNHGPIPVDFANEVMSRLNETEKNPTA